MSLKRRKNDTLIKKSIWDEELLGQVLPSKRHRNQVWHWFIRHPSHSIADIPYKELSLPHQAYHTLVNEFHLFTTKVVTKQVSKRGDTTKLLVELQDGHQIEAVVMKHSQHSTVCVSSQIGCAMGCKFCATGTLGILGDLTSGEIIEQLIHANQVSKIRNVVFMGMGEPLNNYENVKRAVQFMIDDQRLGLSARHVTISTVGVVKYMKLLSDDLPNCNLALSLHAPTQDIRLKIVPTATAHPIEKLMAALDYHIEKNNLSEAITRKQKKLSKDLKLNSMNLLSSKTTGIMIEYILIDQINDRPEHAHILGSLLATRREYILLNLIPYNPTDVSEDYHPPSEDSVLNFSNICRSDPYHIHTRVRQEMGQDIDGACGQLVIQKANSKNANKFVDIEDIIPVRKSEYFHISSSPLKLMIPMIYKRSLPFLLPVLAYFLNK